MKAAYVWLTRLIALGVVLQAAFVAWGTFDIFRAANDGEAFTESTEYNVGQSLHMIVGGTVIPLLGLLLLIVSFFVKVPGAVRFALVVLGLVVLQVALAYASFPAPVVGLLHGITAFLLAGAAGWAGGKIGRSGPTAPAETSAAAAAA